MLPPNFPPDEPQRIQALLDTGLLDSHAEERFDRLTRLAKQVLGVPIALVSLIDTDRQWFKSRQGLDACETERDISFCGHAILGNDIFEVPDTLSDPRFTDNPLVTGPPHIRFYAGAPLSTRSGHRIGTLCVISHYPRTLNDTEREILRDLADCVQSEIDHLDVAHQHEALAISKEIGRVITRAQSEFIREDSRHKAFDGLLNDLLALTASEYGFIGEILHHVDGSPYLKTYAITNIAWSEETKSFYEEHAPQGMEFSNLKTLFGAAMTTGEPVIANDPYHDHRRGGLPDGHPALNAFLGVPVYQGGEMLAMFGLANRPGGYDQRLLDQLQPLVATIGQLVRAARIRHQHEQALAELARLSRVASETTNGVMITDAQGRFQWVNEGFIRLTGYSLREILGLRPGDVLHGPGTDASKVALMHEALVRQQSFEVDVLNYAKDGRPYWLRISSNPLRDAEGELQGFIAIMSDITVQRQSEQELRQFKSTLDQTLDCVFMFDAQELRFFYANEGALRQVGYERAELFSMHPYDIKPEFSPEGFRAMIEPLLSRKETALTFDTVHRHKSGQLVPVEVFLQLVALTDQKPHFVAIVRDITERKQNEAQLRHQATHDALTGLPNRTLLLDRLSLDMARAQREDRRVGVLLLDLDNFKVVNDSFGHHHGDVLLIEVATRLSRAMRAGDTVARLGGDEFSAILANVEHDAQVRGTADRLLEVLNEPVTINGREITPLASIGYCLYPIDGQDPETLLRHADSAMYAAKAAGRGTVSGYRSEMDDVSKDQLHLLTRLRHAVALGNFQLHYQPQVDTDTGRIVGAEALLRWNDAELGTVPPDRFIPVAEASGLILPIGDWVLETACRQIAAWHAAGLVLPVAINLSPYQFRQTDLVAKIQSACNRHGCPVHLLELEITETAAMQSPELTQRQLAALADAGFSLALDDFGTGYSSLARLGQLRVNKLKIDRSFIVEVPGNPMYETLVRTTISLGNEMGMRLVAEGVETEEQRGFLALHGCTAYQGWLFSKAIPADQFCGLV